MGCDGGTIPKRDELIRTKKKAEQKDKISELNFLWQHCAISQNPLREPIVSCGLGKVYNKDAVIMGILDKSAMPEGAKHIKSIKEVKELNLTKNPSFADNIRKGDSYEDHQNAPYICPVLGLEMNGRFKFCFYWSCGCVFSERALKGLKSVNCHKCQKQVQESDLVILNATEEDLEVNRVRMEERLIKMKKERKAKKAETTIKVEEEEVLPPNDDRLKMPPPSSSGTSKSGSTELEKKPVLEDMKKPATIGSKLKNGNSSGLKRSGTALGMQTKEYKKTKGDYSIASDPNASDVLKSLFTSSGAAKSQEKAHWITYNPFYN